MRRKGSGFILLEVLVAMVVLAVAMVALIKGFVASLDTIQRVNLNEKAILLAKTLMDDLILEPPAEGDYEFDFSEDARFGDTFAGWTAEMEVEADEPDYRERPPGKMLQELEELYTVTITIFFEKNDEKRSVLRLNTILMEPDLFSQEAMQANQLF